MSSNTTFAYKWPLSSGARRGEMSCSGTLFDSFAPSLILFSGSVRDFGTRLTQ